MRVLYLYTILLYSWLNFQTIPKIHIWPHKHHFFSEQILFIDIFVNQLIRKSVFIILEQQTIASEKRPIVFHRIPKWQKINSETVFTSTQYGRGIHGAPGGTVSQRRDRGNRLSPVTLKTGCSDNHIYRTPVVAVSKRCRIDGSIMLQEKNT